MTSWSVGQMLYHQATGDLVTDPREGAGGGGWLALPYFWTKLRPEGPKKIFPRPPPPSYLRVWMTAPPRLLGAEETRARFM